MTYVGTARLEHPDLDDFVLDIEHGFAVDSLDLGYPPPRAAVQPNPERHGDEDLTRFFGGRAVVLSGHVVPVAGDEPLSRQQVLDRLGDFLVPWRRPWLVYELEPGSGLRRMRLRPDQHSRPITQPGMARVTVGFRAPDGIQEAYDPIAVIGGTGPGYSEEYEDPYSGIPSSIYDNIGNVPVYPVIRGYGPATGVSFYNDTTGAGLVLDGPLLATEDDFVDVDFGAQTIVLNGVTDLTGEDLLVLPESSWWWLEPGPNEIRYRPSGYGLEAHQVISARPGWI